MLREGGETLLLHQCSLLCPMAPCLHGTSLPWGTEDFSSVTDPFFTAFGVCVGFFVTTVAYATVDFKG